jgi:hypothetical protein
VILFLAIILAMLSAYLVLSAFQPLTEGEVMTAEEWERLEDETLSLLERRDRVFEEIRELEFESALNKVEPEEFKRLQRRYEDQAIQIMDQLQVEFDTYGSRIERDILDLIETAKLRKAGLSSQGSTPAPVPTNTPVEDTIASTTPVVEKSAPSVRDAAGLTTKTMPCAQCHELIPKGSRFCDVCGAPQEKKCSVCAELNRIDARFCKGCGAPLDGAEASS